MAVVSAQRRLGRVCIQFSWPSSPYLGGSREVRSQWHYDRDSNRLYRDNGINAAFGELYHANGSTNGYDNFNQLLVFQRGTLNPGKDSIVGNPIHSLSWNLDTMGNWSSVTTDGGTPVTRTHNEQNEVTAVNTTPVSPLTSDKNGNTLVDETGKQFVYDAWNRLTQVFSAGITTTSTHHVLGPTDPIPPLITYKYDALNRRIVEAPTTGTTLDLYYSANWQVLEERDHGTMAMTSQYVWSPVYVDALVERVDSTGQRLFVQQDANWNVTALVTAAGAVVERYVYDPFGVVTVLDVNWTPRPGNSSQYNWRYFFQGWRFDQFTNLYGVRNRDESPTLGRFMEPDPEQFAAGDTNCYRDEGNRPTSALDPTGLDNIPQGEGRIGAIKYFWVAIYADAKGRRLGEVYAPRTRMLQMYFTPRGLNNFFMDEHYIGALDPDTGLVFRPKDFTDLKKGYWVVQHALVKAEVEGWFATTDFHTWFKKNAMSPDKLKGQGYLWRVGVGYVTFGNDSAIAQVQSEQLAKTAVFHTAMAGMNVTVSGRTFQFIPKANTWRNTSTGRFATKAELQDIRRMEQLQTEAANLEERIATQQRILGSITRSSRAQKRGGGVQYSTQKTENYIRELQEDRRRVQEEMARLGRPNAP